MKMLMLTQYFPPEVGAPQNRLFENAVRWKKMYIDLKELVSNSYDAAYFKQSFQAILDHGDSEGFVVLDNIKVVHF